MFDVLYVGVHSVDIVGVHSVDVRVHSVDVSVHGADALVRGAEVSVHGGDLSVHGGDVTVHVGDVSWGTASDQQAPVSLMFVCVKLRCMCVLTCVRVSALISLCLFFL